MKRAVWMLLAVALVAGAGYSAMSAGAAVNADEEAIRRASMDYIEGYYMGDPEMIARSVHPNWAKRWPRVLVCASCSQVFLNARNGCPICASETWRAFSK